MKWLRGPCWLVAPAAGGRGVGSLVVCTRGRCRRSMASWLSAGWQPTGPHRARRRTASRRSRPQTPHDADVRPRLRPCAGSAVAARDPRRIGAGRLAEAFGEGGAGDRPASCARSACAARRRRSGRNVKPESRAAIAGLHRRHQRLHARADARAAAGVRSSSACSREPWDAGGQHGVGDHDGLGPGRQLEHRAAAHAPRAASCRSHRIDELVPPYPGEKPLATADYAALFRGLKVDVPPASVSRRLLAPRRHPASKAWAPTTGSSPARHSATGKPLLANDPHLKLTAPALWYFARLEAPGFKVAGATMPGLPFVVLGQNEHARLGLHQHRPRRAGPLPRAHQRRPTPARYQTPDGWAAFEIGRRDDQGQGRGPTWRYACARRATGR